MFERNRQTRARSSGDSARDESRGLAGSGVQRSAAADAQLAETQLTDSALAGAADRARAGAERWFADRIAPARRSWHGQNARSGREELVEWLAGRRVGGCGGALYWYRPTPAGLFRRHEPLGPAEVTRWLALPIWFRRQHDVFGGAPLAR